MTNFIYRTQLTQHTPIIHFQHNQDGATLRPTDIKSKITRFVNGDLKLINEALFKDNESIINKYFQEGEDNKIKAPFKLSIIASANYKPDRYLIGSFIPKYKVAEYKDRGFKILDKTPYFANNKDLKDGNLEETKQGLMLNKKASLYLEVFSYDTKILNFIKAILLYIFVYDNFGTRQSKGFGSYSIAEIGNVRDFETILAAHPDYQKSFKYIVSGGISKVFKEIDGEYKVLKSGIAKDASQMMLHYQKQGIEWEKPIIKQRLIGGKGNRKKDVYDQEGDPQYIRALLGLAELYEFPKKNAKVVIRDPTKEIERFRSPITFRVFRDGTSRYHVYMLAPKKVSSEMCGRLFEFSLNENESISLKTPKDLNIHQFLKEHRHSKWKHYR